MTQRDYTDNYSTLPALDTPLKPSLTVQTARSRTLAADIEKMVENELGSHCVVTDIENFINHYFNVPSEVIDKVYEKMVEGKFYNNLTETWPSIPQESAKESAFYTPLITVCEAIRKAYNSDGNKHYSCRWFMSPDNPPKSPDTASSLIRPDIFLLLGMDGEAQKWEEKFEMLKRKEPELIKNVTAWWLRVSVIIEVKRKDDKDVLSRVTQLMTYIRQILREQLDRWFVPGFLLTGTQFAAWVVDRSGAFGTQKSFNFHKEPKKFIQIILACSMLPPSKLGWDTSMKLWKSPEPLHSFSENINIEDYAENAYARQWVFEMPVRNKEDKLDGKRGLFLTTKALSVVRAECMQGRATVVWAAQRLKDGQVSSDEIFILKQCWRPITSKPEGELYPPAEEAQEHHIGCVYSHEDVKVDGMTINTHEFIRGGLEHIDPLPATNIKESRKRGAENFQNAEQQESHVFIVPVTDHEPLIFNFKEVNVTDRVLSRTLLSKSHGWALHRFSDRLELVRVCDDIVEALEYLYFQKGTIQRDISIGNVLISSITGTNGAKGCLIDFDYAKVVKEKKLTIIHETKDWFLSREQQDFRDVLVVWGKKLPPRAAHVLAFYDDARKYLRDLKTIIKKSSVSNAIDLSDEDIGFLSDVNIRIPDLTKHKPQKGKRSATLPFASPEVLNAKRIFDLPLPHPEDDDSQIGSDNYEIVSEDSGTDSEDTETDCKDSETDSEDPETDFEESESNSNDSETDSDDSESNSNDSETDSDDSENDSKEDDLSITPHDARHDLEALFWCMTYICVTRSGPGGRRRKELRPEFEDKGKKKVMKLRHINYCFFSSDQETLIHNKTKLFRRNDYNKAVVRHFHPYFKPLKPLMRRWWNILRFAHKYPMFELIHKTLRKTLKTTIKKLRKQRASPQDLRKTAKVMEKRKKELEEIRRPFHSEFRADPEESASSAPLDASPRNDRILRSHRAGSDYRGSAMTSSSSRSTSRPRKKAKNSADN